PGHRDWARRLQADRGATRRAHLGRITSGAREYLLFHPAASGGRLTMGTGVDMGRPIEILLVEDSPSDAELTREALHEGKVLNNLHVVTDGEQALDFLRHQGKYPTAPRPDLILLDLNLPRKDGRQVLEEVKSDSSLKCIPVVVLTTSKD